MRNLGKSRSKNADERELILSRSYVCTYKYTRKYALYRTSLEKRKEEYFISKVLEADPMVFFKVIDKLLNTTSKPVLPLLSTAREVAI